MRTGVYPRVFTIYLAVRTLAYSLYYCPTGYCPTLARSVGAGFAPLSPAS
jgi:hypothetical protein